MPSKRSILDALTRTELQTLADAFQLAVPNRRVKEQLVDAAAGSRKLDLATVLADYSRDRLKEICRALDLDEGGKDKASLVERLTGKAPNGAANRAAEPATEVPHPSAQLTTAELERYLWSAADILRGSIDSSGYKSFIFGRLFLKRLSDRYQEECDALRVTDEDPDDRDNHQFVVPKPARWSEIQKVSTGLGDVLNKACRYLEDENHKLEGVLGGIDYNDQNKLGDAKQRDNILNRLVQHFSRLDLRNSNLSEPDMLGRAYEYLIEKFADDAGKKGGEFYTTSRA